MADTGSTAIDIIVVSNTTHIRVSVTFLLQQQSDIVVMGSYAYDEMVLEQIVEARPDVVLLEKTVNDRASLDLIQKLRRDQHDVVIIALIDWIDAADALLNAGADAYIFKNEAHALLLAITRRLVQQARRSRRVGPIELIVTYVENADVAQQVTQRLLELDQQLGNPIIDITTTQGHGMSIDVGVQFRPATEANYGYRSGDKIRYIIHHQHGSILETPLSEAAFAGQYAVMLLCGQEHVVELLRGLQPLESNSQRFIIGTSLHGPVNDT